MASNGTVNPQGNNSTNQHSAGAIVRKAEEFLASYEVEMAEKFYSRALEMEPTNTKIMDALAAIKMECGDVLGAKHLLHKSIAADPNGGYEKYFCFGQISNGAEAVESILRGLVVVENRIRSGKAGEEDLVSLRRVAASAYCNIVEIYMTDLCDEKDAEENCEKYVKMAIDLDKEGIEPLQSLASLRIVQRRLKDAVGAMQRVSERLKRFQEAKGTDLTPLASYEVREKTLQLFMETNMPEDTLSLAHIMLHENDEIVNVWYLGSVAAMQLGDFEHAAELLSHAEKKLTGALKVPENATDRDEIVAQLQSIRDLHADCRVKNAKKMATEVDSTSSGGGGGGGGANNSGAVDGMDAE